MPEHPNARRFRETLRVACLQALEQPLGLRLQTDNKKVFQIHFYKLRKAMIEEGFVEWAALSLRLETPEPEVVWIVKTADIEREAPK